MTSMNKYLQSFHLQVSSCKLEHLVHFEARITADYVYVKRKKDFDLVLLIFFVQHFCANG